jgi:phosphoglycolate phosphatase
VANPRLVWFGPRSCAVRAIAFDKDGTLLATGPFWQQLAHLRHALVAEAAGERAAGIWLELMGIAPGWTIDRTGPFALGSFEEEVQVTAVALYRATGLPWTRCKAQAAEIIHRSNMALDPADFAQLLPGAREVVLGAKAAGLAVGVITSDFVQRAVASLEHVGLPASTWDFILGAESVPSHKPAPDAVLEAARLTCVPPEAFAVVGDSPVDMQMARAAGALAVGVRENGAETLGLSAVAEVVLDGVYEIRIDTGGRSP